MRVLVTGGAGFIGSHLVERLLKEGHNVVVLDDLSTGSLDNLGDALCTRLRVVVDSVLNQHEIDHLVEWADCVYHLAAVVGIFSVMQDPSRCLKVNIQGTENVINACLDRIDKTNTRLIIASTSEVYGKNDGKELIEDMDVMYGNSQNYRWSYAASKLVDEFMAVASYKKHGLPVTICRFFNTVGPRQSPAYGMVLPRFIKQAKAGDPITVFGDGKQVRSFTYVQNTVEALMRLKDCEASYGEIVNIGSNHPIPIIDLARLVKIMLLSKSPISVTPYKEAYGDGYEDTRYRVPCTDKLKKLTGYAPDTSISDIIAITASKP